jgi:transposase
VINAIRAHLAESGIVAPVGRNGVEQLLGIVADPKDKRLPEVARVYIAALGTQLRVLKAQVLNFDRQIMAWHRSNETSKRLDEIPGVGPVLATAWSPASPIQRRSHQDETSRPGSGWYRSNTRAGAGTSSAVSASKATAICVSRRNTIIEPHKGDNTVADRAKAIGVIALAPKPFEDS